jgi:PAS domain S-box-containing protein
MAFAPLESSGECPLASRAISQDQHCAHWSLHNLPIAIYRCQADRDWTMTVLTESIRTLTGYSALDLIENRHLRFTDLICPEDRDRVRREVYAALEEHRPFAIEYRYITASQEMRWMADRGQGYWNEAGNLQYLDGVLMDVTDHKQAEEQLHLLSSACEQSPASIVITDNRGNIQYVNPKFEAITGYSAAEVRGKNPKILKTGHTPPETISTALGNHYPWQNLDWRVSQPKKEW